MAKGEIIEDKRRRGRDQGQKKETHEASETVAVGRANS